MPWITGGFLVVQGVQAGKHLAESKLKLFFCFCMNKCIEKAEKSSAHSGSVGRPACILLLAPVPACSCLGCAASLEPTAISLLSKTRGVFVSLLFSGAEGCHSHPKCIFPSFSAQKKFLILCTITEYHETVITLP